MWKQLYYGSMSDKEKAQLVAEVNILREMDHVHIMKYYDRIIGEGSTRHAHAQMVLTSA